MADEMGNNTFETEEPLPTPGTDFAQPEPQTSSTTENTGVIEKIMKLTKGNRPLQIVLALTVLLLLISIIIGIAGSARAAKTAAKAYSEAEKNAEEDWREKLIHLVWDRVNHPVVTDKISVSVEEVRALSNMEVLQVSDVELIIHEKDKNGITAALEVPGTGKFTVNYQLADFIVDQERHYVLVRIPYPELTECDIEYADVVKMGFTNNIFNDSVKVGEDVAKDMLANADLKIEKEFTSNPQFTERANEAAINVTESLIRDFNPDIDDLVVEVEFIEK